MASEKLLPKTSKPKRTNCLAIALILLSPLALTDMSYAAGRVFYDGFESGSVDAAWRDDGGLPFCPVVSTSVDGVAGPYAGTKMLRCNHAIGDSTGFENLVLDVASRYNDELFIRTRVRVDQDMDRTTSSTKKILRFFLNTGGVYHDMFELIRPTAGLNHESHSQLNVAESTYWGVASGDNTAVTTDWHKVEYYIKQSTGAMKVWHDGVLVRNELGLNYVGVKWSPFYITSNFHDAHDATNHVYFDEFEIFSDNGTGATGLMSSATITQGGSTDITPSATTTTGGTTDIVPPATPQNVKIN